MGTGRPRSSESVIRLRTLLPGTYRSGGPGRLGGPVKWVSNPVTKSTNFVVKVSEVVLRNGTRILSQKIRFRRRAGTGINAKTCLIFDENHVIFDEYHITIDEYHITFDEYHITFNEYHFLLTNTTLLSANITLLSTNTTLLLTNITSFWRK